MPLWNVKGENSRIFCAVITACGEAYIARGGDRGAVESGSSTGTTLMADFYMALTGVETADACDEEEEDSELLSSAIDWIGVVSLFAARYCFKDSCRYSKKLESILVSIYDLFNCKTFLIAFIFDRDLNLHTNNIQPSL